MANLSFSGKITEIGVTQSGTGKNGEWSNTTIRVEETEGEHPNSIIFSALNKQEIVDTLSVGAIVEVLYNAKTNDYNGKTYNSLNVWKINNTGGSQEMPDTTQKTTTQAPSEVDDLPF